ncbi:MAG: SusC/RagA family TonB-linked outer membrane protein [Candidatus Pseudobacter hemicellulosilyticus]|uniref:SusC/RagA family TonB-linked outer membrane protein n=1 Tax=Candidatus Pseudobacter hemicellulosilyticus TaxID=3121375 RepID=A0AAJ6BIN9_9BACT|nr:MAG: SusC/RagA family TonB-linked outer membrane protein [Pseudobacter sp.]
MKLTAAILLITCLHVSAGVHSQSRITLNMESTDLKSVLAAIEKKTSYRFLYNQSLLSDDLRVNVRAADEEVLSVLDRLLLNTSLSYQLLQNNLIVLKKAGSGTWISSEPEKGPITGRVLDSLGNPVAGASVRVKGNTGGTSTDDQGRFSMTVPDDAVLVISSVGFETQEVSVAGKTTIDVTLRTVESQLEQVVVIGYGTSSRKDLTGAVGVVNPEELNKRMTASPMQALQGNAPGVQVVTNGAPGGSPTVRIRGVGSLINTAPLYVVDGMFMDNIDFLNTNDIGEMTVLKDASAAAIYGVRAANGVVIINTRKGKYNQKTRVTYNGYFGVQQPTGNFDLANGSEYAAMQLAKRTNADSLRVTTSVAKFGGSGLNPSTNTDWYDELMKSSALMHNHSIDLAGGSNKVSYTVGVNYLFQDGVTEAENNYKRYNIRLQMEAKPYEWLKLGLNTHLSNWNQRNPNRESFALAYFASPLYPVMDPSNSLAYPVKYTSSTSLGYNNGIFNNPIASANYWYDKSKTFQILPTIYAEAEIIKSKLTFRTQLSQRYASGLNQNYMPQYYVDNTQQKAQSTLTTTEDRVENYILDNLLTYKDGIKDHRWTVLLGQSVREERYRSTQVITDGVPDQQEFWYADQGTRRIDGYNETGARNGSASFFGRINYDYAGRYLLAFTFRADGSSKYQDKWGYFPSVGLGWVISEESFMQNQNLFSNLKLRGSWGKLGNDGINPNTGYAIINTGNGYSGIFGSTGSTNGTYINGYRIEGIFGNIGWEEVTEWNGGVDFTMLGNKLSGSLDYFHRQTDQLVFERGVPFTGTRQIGNWGTVNNSGFEIVLNWRDKIGNWGYQIGGNLSTLKNEVVDLYGLNNMPTGVPEFPTRLQVGQPFNFFYGYEVEGIYQNQAEIAADPIAVANGVQPGYFKYKDQNGDKLLNDQDRVNIGSYLPKMYYGFNINLDYKNFDFGVFFQGTGGNKILNNNRTFRQKFPDINGDKELITNLWTGEGSTNKYPSAYALTQSWNNNASSFYVENGSYLRLQNVQLGYNFKVGKENPASFRVYATADRPLIWTRYSGVTPEVAAPSQLPKDRSGIPSTTPANFISATGYDQNVYPTTAVYTIGVRITY